MRTYCRYPPRFGVASRPSPGQARRAVLINGVRPPVPACVAHAPPRRGDLRASKIRSAFVYAVPAAAQLLIFSWAPWQRYRGPAKVRQRSLATVSSWLRASVHCASVVAAGLFAAVK